MNRNCCSNRQNDINANFNAENMNVDVDVDFNNGMMNNSMMGTPMMGGAMMSGTTQAPIIEAGQERQIHRTIMHEVPHVCPIRTRIINHHVYRHTYQPAYSCCEENTCSEIQCGSCCNFR